MSAAVPTSPSASRYRAMCCEVSHSGRVWAHRAMCCAVECCSLEPRSRRRWRSMVRNRRLLEVGSAIGLCWIPSIPLTVAPLNPTVQGGGPCAVSGFPVEAGLAHQQLRGASRFTFIGSRTVLSGAYARHPHVVYPALPEQCNNWGQDQPISSCRN